MTYPKKLRKDPIIDTVCDIRFVSSYPDGVVPTLLADKLGMVDRLKSLPGVQIPQAVRNADPHLKHVPLYGADLEGFPVRFGDGVVAISSSIPYVGWITFHNQIKQVVQALSEIGLVDQVQRAGLRTINFFPSIDVYEKLKLEIIDPVAMESSSCQYTRVFQEGNLKSRIAIINDASYTGQQDSVMQSGSVIDIDTFWDNENSAHEQVDIVSNIDKCHYLGKSVFFDFLQDEFINDLGPE